MQLENKTPWLANDVDLLTCRPVFSRVFSASLFWKKEKKQNGRVNDTAYHEFEEAMEATVLG